VDKVVDGSEPKAGRSAENSTKDQREREREIEREYLTWNECQQKRRTVTWWNQCRKMISFLRMIRKTGENKK
jgi:hypothetical protein